MLKTATIFKDFKISINATNTAVTFAKVGAVSVSVKNDNFATQVQILDSYNNVDLFDYKYITFDNFAVFEIKDCIKNLKFTTLFIQYLSNITFDAADTNFRVDAVSANSLQRLGLDINQFAEILGSSLNISYVNYIAADIAAQEPFMFGIKLRFSQYPADLSYRFTANENEVVPAGDNAFLNQSSRVFNPSVANISLEPSIFHFNSIKENAKTVIVPIPNSGLADLRFGNGSEYTFNAAAAIRTLSALITDLTLSAEIIYISSNTLMANHNNTIKKFTVGASYIQLPTPFDADFPTFLNLVRVPSSLLGLGQSTAVDAAPCFLIDGISAALYFCEALDFFKVQLPPIAENECYTNVNFLSNVIDLSKMRNNYFYLKRESGFIRVFIDIEKNIYTDIVTTLEFAKDAYSNFDAYKKSNIELVNAQNNATLKQMQAQKRETQNLNHIISGANTIKGAAFSMGMGSQLGAAGALVSGAIGIAAEEAKFNMQQQNDRANLKLSSAHALELAQKTIVPSEELRGSVALITALKDIYNVNAAKICTAFVLSKIVVPAWEKYMLVRYVFENYIMDKINAVAQITKPQWQTVNNCYQIKICNRNPLNTRKDLIIFAED